ncbi:FecR protein [Nitrobacter winogradskyi Nb-255]|uniref:FecR protein n=2 Tax=Nitrobacter winogradskyi TaxID=913 RepID=Q3SN13_NITWN|nr:FecR protein [Nitrobacter winogradskyi Nb-255]
MHPDPVTDQALDWFIRLQEERDSATLAEFEAWRRSDMRCGQAFARISAMHGMASLRKATETDARRLGLDVPASAVSVRERKAPRSWIPAVAAAVLLLLIGWQQLPGVMLRWQSDYMTATGQRDTITLPDGSTATLNTSTAIAVDFSGGRRRVTLLDGEAYFDVQHDPSRPFVVAGHFAQVEVKGTAFSVRTENDQDTVVLERGRVEVSSQAGHEFLAPGQMIVASASGLSAVEAADIDKSLAWRDGRIVFRDRPFRAALADLERYFDGRVVVIGSVASDRLVSGHYRIDDPDAAIRTLARSAGADVTRLPGGILILR